MLGNQDLEILQHGLDQGVLPVSLKAQHREIGVPVVDLAEAAAGDDVGRRQGQGRRALGGLQRRACQHRPKRRDMGPQRQAFRNERGIRCGRRVRDDETGLDEGPQGCFALRAFARVVRHDLGHWAAGHGVHEGLAVPEHLAGLNRFEQGTIEVGGRRVGYPRRSQHSRGRDGQDKTMEERACREHQGRLWKLTEGRPGAQAQAAGSLFGVREAENLRLRVTAVRRPGPLRRAVRQDADRRTVRSAHMPPSTPANPARRRRRATDRRTGRGGTRHRPPPAGDAWS